MGFINDIVECFHESSNLLHIFVKKTCCKIIELITTTSKPNGQLGILYKTRITILFALILSRYVAFQNP